MWRTVCDFQGLVPVTIRPPHPAADRRVLAGIDRSETDLSRFEIGFGLGQGFGQLDSQVRNVIRIGVGSQTTERRRRRMRMRRRDHDAVGFDFGAASGQLLGFVQQLPRHHATVHHDQTDSLAAIVQDQGSRVDFSDVLPTLVPVEIL